ncbi:MAG: zinc ribbon domain-containing protein, partial [Planctomycetales bacterium]|nr:zinc ribbon domain-containing protein [Planctomycetales bacterium]
MILIGTMNWASTRLRGMFTCPSCGDTEKFRLRASRPFLTLYFVPVLPIGGMEEYVQCGRCKTSFETDILAISMIPSSESGGQIEGPSEVSFEQDLLKVIALMM